MNGRQPYARRSGPSPCPTFWCEHVRMSAHELLLLVWGERHHAECHVVVQRCEDPILDAEVRVAHVRAFDGSLHAQRNPAEVIRAHGRSRRKVVVDERNDLGGTITCEIMSSALHDDELCSREQFGKPATDRHWADRIAISPQQKRGK